MNIWSILNVEKLENFLQTLEDNEISVACITETWFDAKVGLFSQKIKSRGFELHHAHREEKRGGGVAIMFKKQLMVKPGDASTSTYSSFEYCCIVMTMQSKRRLVLICVYRKQEIHINTFIEEFTLFMDKTTSKGEVFLVVGDFNVWMEIEEDQDAKRLMLLMSSFGLTQKVEGPTHRDGHTLDHVYVNEFQLEIDYEVLPDTQGLTTDHFPIIMKLPIPANQNKTKSVTYRKLKNIDMEGFKKDLESSYDKIHNSQSNFKEMYSEYHEVSQSVVDKYAAVQRRIVTSREPSWMDKEYKENRARRRQLERKWKKNKSDENRNHYINQKKVCTELALAKQTRHY